MERREEEEEEEAAPRGGGDLSSMGRVRSTTRRLVVVRFVRRPFPCVAVYARGRELYGPDGLGPLEAAHH